MSGVAQSGEGAGEALAHARVCSSPATPASGDRARAQASKRSLRPDGFRERGHVPVQHDREDEQHRVHGVQVEGRSPGHEVVMEPHEERRREHAGDERTALDPGGEAAGLGFGVGSRRRSAGPIARRVASGKRESGVTCRGISRRATRITPAGT